MRQQHHQQAIPKLFTCAIWKQKRLAPLLGKVAANILGKNSGGSDTSTTASTTSPSGSSSASASKSTDTTINSPNIQPEPNTNAVIITAPPALMQALKAVIAKLDIRPAQVLVEAMIAEVDESNLTSLGIQWGSVTRRWHGSNCLMARNIIS